MAGGTRLANRAVYLEIASQNPSTWQVIYLETPAPETLGEGRAHNLKLVYCRVEGTTPVQNK